MLALHIPDGFIDGPTSLLAGVIAIGGIALCLRRTSATLAEREIPIVGLVAAFVFAAQMINFPVANGTSGHLLGGVLAGVLVGPWAGALAVSVVLVVQALLFADGGLSALGLNIVNMALAGTFVGYGIFLLLRRRARQHTVVGDRRLRAGGLPRADRRRARLRGRVRARRQRRGLGWIGGYRDARCTRPDRHRRGHHHDARRRRGDGLAARPRLRRPGHQAADRGVGTGAGAVVNRRISYVAFLVIGLAAALTLVIVLAPNANPNPDGLEKVAADTGIDNGMTDHALADGPLADYGVSGVDNTWVATWIAGGLGIAATFILCAGLVYLVRRRT